MTFSLTSTPESPIEEFYFWVYLCNWWIRTTDSELAHCESTDEEIVAAVSALNGRKLNEITLHHNVTPDGLFHGASLAIGDDLTMKLCQYEDSSPDDAIFMTRNAAKDWGFISYRWLDQDRFVGLTMRCSERRPVVRLTFPMTKPFHLRSALAPGTRR